MFAFFRANMLHFAFSDLNLYFNDLTPTFFPVETERIKKPLKTLTKVGEKEKKKKAFSAKFAYILSTEKENYRKIDWNVIAAENEVGWCERLLKSLAGGLVLFILR